MGITLKAARVNCNLTQKQAAEAMGIAPGTLSRYERGVSFPDVQRIGQMEALYGVKYDDLIFLPQNYGLSVKPKAFRRPDWAG